jgi:ferrous iron transport protein B
LVINVIDASQLGRSLPLTLELIEIGVPIIIALNMIDEAGRKGIEIDAEKLSEMIGVPVQVTVASKNVGVRELFLVAKQVIDGKLQVNQKKIKCQKDVEEIIVDLESVINQNVPLSSPYPPRFLAIKLLEDDDFYRKLVDGNNGNIISKKIEKLQGKLVSLRGKPQDSVLTLERHAMAMDIYNHVVTVGTPQRDLREKIDDVVMHKFAGYLILIGILVAFFYGVFEIGAIVEGFLLAGFENLNDFLTSYFASNNLLFHFTKAVIWGISGGIAIVLPYLIPFLIGLTLLEDIGYLPRVAYLMDAFMHRIGLHGTSIVPAVLGFGCNVPAVMATRVLPSRRDKIISAVIASMVPCSARSVVIFGLVAFYLSPFWAFMIYVFNMIVIAFSGKVLSLLMPEVSPGMVLEIPPYRFPSFQVIRKKTWFRIKEFIYVAWPILIIGSVILGLLEYFHLDGLINWGLSPLTSFLGLPMVVGTTLIFGILRKELALVMLTQALGTTDVISVMSINQILTFTIFITFYIPCVATMAVLVRELSRSWMLVVVGITLALAIIFSFLAHISGNMIL